jgi:hypothetical protein
MVNDPQEDTTVVLKRIAPTLALLPRFVRAASPAAVWAAMGSLFAASLGMYHAMVAAHTEVGEFKEAIRELQADRKNVLERLARVEQLETDIKEEQDRQREWRERIEYVAEREHPRKRK